MLKSPSKKSRFLVHELSVFLLTSTAVLTTATSVQAAGKSSTSAQQTAQPKKVITLGDIPSVTISIPKTAADSPTLYDFGPNLQNSLINKMSASGRYQLYQAQPAPVSSPSFETGHASSSAPTQWTGTQMVPAATITFTVNALVFRSGGKGDSMFYGFDERFRTPYNDGSGKLADEFPLSLVQFQPNQFDANFNDKGSAPFDSQGGLDLGEGFQLNVLMAWVDAKWASYHSEIRLTAVLDAPLANRHEVKTVSVTGHGFFFDIVGGYQLYSGGIGLARTDAMTNAFNQAFAGMFSVIDNWTKDLPLTAFLYGTSATGDVYLNTGATANIPVGTQYQVVGHPELSSLIVQVTQSVDSGSIGKLISGNLSDLQPGMTLVEYVPTSASQFATAAVRLNDHGIVAPSVNAPIAVAAESVELPKTNLPKTDFSGISGLKISFGQAFLASLEGLPLLPYRIWRYFEFDQAYRGTTAQAGVQSDVGYDDDSTPAESSSDQKENSKSQQKDSATGPMISTAENGAGAMSWAESQLAQPFAKQIGLTQALLNSDFTSGNSQSTAAPVVAVIDTGVDYNHTALRDSIWVNPSPFTDPLGHSDTLGWDFISGDSRPFDDLYHGTEIASALVSIAPEAVIMPLKAFNPWGVTSSASLYAAFHYAVDHGAQIILCSWATRVKTQTLELAIQYAQDHGVLVVTSAGDRGEDLSMASHFAYPAVMSTTHDNVLTVAGVDTTDQLVKVSGAFSNFDPSTVQIAAPGLNIRVADPRNHTGVATTTGVAAAMVAGQVVRNLTQAQLSGTAMGSYHDWMNEVLSQADVVPALTTSVHGGLRLHVR